MIMVFSNNKLLMDTKLKYLTIGSSVETLGKLRDKMLYTQSDSMDMLRSTRMVVSREVTGKVERWFLQWHMTLLSQGTTLSIQTTSGYGDQSHALNLILNNSMLETTMVLSQID